MTLGELIDVLERANPATVVSPGFGHPHSYRGVYAELAFEPVEKTTIGEMLAAAKSAVGKTFDGWKGGEYCMDIHTEVHIANCGECGDGISFMLLRYMIGSSKSKCYACDGKGKIETPCHQCKGVGELERLS